MGNVRTTLVVLEVRDERAWRSWWEALGLAQSPDNWNEGDFRYTTPVTTDDCSVTLLKEVVTNGQGH